MASLLSLIKQAIFSRAKSDVTIHERTFVTELLESEHKGDPFALYDFFPRKYRGKSLVITRHLIYFFRCVVLFFIGIVYAFYDVAHKVVTGKWKSQRLTEEVLKRRVPNTKWAKRLHTDKWRGIQSSTGVNAVIFTVVIISAVISLAFSLNFLIREVVLPDNEARINGKGVVSIDQGALVTQHFFILNAATCWTNSDIAVSEGDKVFISASGSMYSDVGDMCDAARENRTLKYPRSDFHGIPEDYTDTHLCIYGRCSGDSQPQFGSLLYQVCEEKKKPLKYNNKPYKDEDDAIVKQIVSDDNRGGLLKKNVYQFKAKTSGILYFSFNDILLDTAMINKIGKGDSCSNEVRDDLLKMAKDTIEVLSNLQALNNKYNNEKNKKDSMEQGIMKLRDASEREKDSAKVDSLKKCIKKLEDTVHICNSKMDSLFKKAQILWLKDSNHVDEEIWFYDNLGEALINVRVERNIWDSGLPFYKKLLVALYRGVNDVLEPTASQISWLPESLRRFRLYLAILIVIAYFGLDAFVSSLLNPQKRKSRPNRRRKSKTV